MSRLTGNEGFVRKVVIYIGTHKTGTTSRQAFMAENRASLKECGILYPYAGTKSKTSGHHNIAWEIGKDQRIDARRATVNDLLLEVSTAKERTTVLSSEDFENLSQRPTDLRRFDRALMHIGLSTEYVVLFGNMDCYCRSLYRELVKHGLTLSEQDFLVRVRETQSFLMKGNWFFDFDRSRFLKSWQEIVGDKIVPYDFDCMVSGKGLLPEFFTLIGASDSVVRESEKAPRLNLRPVESTQLGSRS